MNHFSRKNLSFLAPQFGPINTLWSKPRNRVLTFLFNTSFPIIIQINCNLLYASIEDPIVRGRLWLVLLFRFYRAREGDLKGRGGLSFSPLVRANASSKFLLPSYKLQQGFGGHLASPSLLLSSLFSRFDIAVKSTDQRQSWSEKS